MSIETSSPERHGPRRPATTVRIAMWSAHHRWPVLSLWLLTMIGLFVVSVSMGGAKLQGATGGGDSRTEAQQGIDAFTNAGHNEPGQSFWLVLGARQGGVADPASKAAAATIIDQLRAATVKLDGGQQPTPIFESLTSPLEAPAMVGLVSADGKAELAVGRIAGESSVVEEKTTALQPLLTQLAVQHPELQVMPLSSAIVNREVGELVNNDLDGSLKLTLPLTFLILLFAFGTVVAGLVPIFLAITALIGAFGAIGIYSRLFEPISQHDQPGRRAHRAGGGHRLLPLPDQPLPDRAARRPQRERCHRGGQQHGRSSGLLQRHGGGHRAGRPADDG